MQVGVTGYWRLKLLGLGVVGRAAASVAAPTARRAAECMMIV